MANAQLNDIPLGMATPSRESGALDSEDHRVIDENVSFTAVAVETDKVVESLGSSHKARRNISSRQDDEMSLVDGTEEDVRQAWSDLDTKNPKRKRDDSVPSRKGKIKHRKVVNHSSSSSENTSSSESSSSNSESESSEDNEAFDPEPSLSKDKKEKVPSHVTKYIEKYALKGISKKTRQDMSLNWPIPSSKGLKALETDRFFKKNYFQGRKWNARLERSKINTQLRILDVMGPLSRLWSEAHRIKKDNQGMDPSDVIQLTQRAIVLAGNAHYVYNTDRRKAMLVKTMPDSLDFLNEKKGKKALAKSKGQLFGNKFLKSLAKENKDNKELREMLLFSNKKKHAAGAHKQPAVCGRQTSSPSTSFREETLAGKPVTEQTGEQLWSAPESAPEPNPDSTSEQPSVQETCKPIERVGQEKTFNHIQNYFQLPMNCIINQNSIPVGGRVSLFLQNWNSITKDPWVLQCVKGIKLDFLATPFQNQIPNQAFFNQENQDLINKEITGLLNKKAITQSFLTKDSFISNIFLVPKKGGGQRPVINLKGLNVFLRYEHFKMEGIHLLKDLLLKNDWMVKIDLTDAYLTLQIAKEHRKYLRFFWQGKIMEFRSLPFGIAVAPRIFTKLMKVPMTLLRRLGVRLIVYLDDILIMNQSNQKILSDLSTVLSILRGLGFLINTNKSVMEPSQTMEFLGYTVNSKLLTLSLPKEKVEKIKNSSKLMLEHKKVSARDLAQLIGQLTATNQAVLPGPLHYRSLQILKTKALHLGGHYDHQIQLNEEVQNELHWWVTKLGSWNGKALLRPEPHLTIQSDASLSGWGATCQQISIGGLWIDEEKSLHINQLELKAAMFALEARSPSESGRCPSPILERDKGLCFSPVLSNKYVSGESSGGKQSDNSDNSSLAIPGLVPSVTSNVSRLSSVTSHESQHCIVPMKEPHPLILNKTLKLAGWTVSGDHLTQLEFQRKLKNYSLGLGNREQDLLTTVPGISGLAERIELDGLEYDWYSNNNCSFCSSVAEYDIEHSYAVFFVDYKEITDFNVYTL
ncbi:unnamed protein product [Mytilus edulis]|uniref:Reverse transcriptase domain-containing protein n=1 Tax=Mytilus edulis TaxID=6550 RepID=A0A8S3QTP7_MYTED|nr:unnamed protein product [Mytilus edulis]